VFKHILQSRRGWIELRSFVHMLNGCPEMSQHVPKYVPKCFEMAICHTNVPGSVGQFASIDGPPEWFPDRIPKIFVLLMSRNVPKCPKNTKVSCPKTCPETSQNVPNIVGMSQNWKRDSASLLCLWFNLSRLMSSNAPHTSQQVLKWSQNKRHRVLRDTSLINLLRMH
jgi:hypothetical protein